MGVDDKEKIFRNLRGKPAADIETIRDNLRDPEVLEQDVLDLLSDPILPGSTRSAVLSAYKHAETNAGSVPELILGGLAYIKLIFEIDSLIAEGNSTPPSAARSDLKSLVRSNGFAKFFCGLYKLDENLEKYKVDLSEGAVHALGTTSFLLACNLEGPRSEQRPKIVLKCVVPQFMSSGSLEQSTRNYATEYNFDYTFVPKVYGSGPAFVAMEFIDGKTIADLLSVQIHERRYEWDPLESERRDFATSVIDELCAQMAILASDDRQHHDLSLDNIIARHRKLDDLVLVDFGPNNLIRIGFVTGPAAERARSYVAIHGFTTGVTTGPSADIRGIAVLLVELLTRTTSTPKGFTEGPVDLESGLQRLWEEAPGMAWLAERLLYERVYVDASDVPDYEALESAVDLELRELGKLDRVRRASREWLWGLVELIHPNPARLEQLWGYGTAPRADVAASRFLALTAYASGIAWRVLFFAFIGYAIHDVLNGDFGPLLLRAASTSTAFIAVAYYLNIFAMIRAADVEAPRALLTEISFRASALVPILLQFVALYKPEFWGVCTAAGGFLIALNNRLAVSLAREANRRLMLRIMEGREWRERRIVSADFDEHYRNWAKNLLVYSSAVFIVWTLHTWQISFWKGWIKDIYPYAVVVLIINLTRMYPQNCWADAARLRATLARATSYLRGRPANPSGTSPADPAS